ncbi:MAG: hypothetical protein WBK28_01380, partial [Minisyncoccia bacterium]
MAGPLAAAAGTLAQGGASRQAAEQNTAQQIARRQRLQNTLRNTSRKTRGEEAESSVQEKPKLRIGLFHAYMLVGVAALFDLAQFLISFLHMIPFVGNGIAVALTWYIAVAAAALFGMVFMVFYKVDYFNGTQALAKMLSVGGSVAIELVPVIDALPAITAGVALVIIYTTLEDMQYSKEAVGFSRSLSTFAKGVGRFVPTHQSFVPAGYAQWDEKRQQQYQV